jgi:hypothetical protein
MDCSKSRHTSSGGQLTSGHSPAKVGNAPQTPSAEQRSHVLVLQARSQQRLSPSTPGAQNPDAQSVAAPQLVPRGAAAR